MTNSNKFFESKYNIFVTFQKVKPLRGDSSVYSRNIHVTISKRTGKTEYIKRAVRNINFSKAAGQDNNITGQLGKELLNRFYVI